MAEEGHDELAGEGLVVVVAGDGAEEDLVAGIACHISADAFPEEEERGVTFLIFGADEGAAEFEERGPEFFEKLLVVAKEGSGVQARDAFGGQDRIGRSEAIGADDFAFDLVPAKEMDVIRIELITRSNGLAVPSLTPRKVISRRRPISKRAWGILSAPQA